MKTTKSYSLSEEEIEIVKRRAEKEQRSESAALGLIIRESKVEK